MKKHRLKFIGKKLAAMAIATALAEISVYFPADIMAETQKDGKIEISDEKSVSLNMVLNEGGNNILPKKYSSVEKGYVTSVKNQGSLGICWAYAACAAMESYALSHGYVSSADDIDLSEFALAYMTYNDSSFVDETGGTEGDVTINKTMQYSFQNGGNDSMAFKPLSKWAAVVDEDKAVSADGLYVGELDNESNKYIYNKEDISYILTGQKYISMKDIDKIKNAIMNNGAVSAMYAVGLQSFSDQYVYNSEISGYNHAIAIVGWDDTIDKSLFANHGVQAPPADGGWLVKNSWNEYAGKDGYFWLSYYDTSMLAGSGVVYEVVPAGTYEHNYQYDGSTIFANVTKQYTAWYNEGLRFANVFQITGNKKQELRAVAFALENENIGYTIDIYKTTYSGSKVMPEGGTCVASTSGKTTVKGYYTVELPKTVYLDPDDVFSVVITFDKVPGIEYSTKSYVTVNDSGEELLRVDNATDVNQSFFFRGSWIDTNIQNDIYPDVNFCIKAFTNDASEKLSSSAITGIAQKSVSKVCIQWKRVDNATGYVLYRSDSLKGTYTKIYSGADTDYEDDTVIFGKKYYYYVKACNDEVTEETARASDIKSVAVGQMTTEITDIASVENGIRLTWDVVEGAYSYEIYGSTDGKSFSLIKTIEENTDCYTDTVFAKKYNTDYYYKIKAVLKNDNNVYKSSDSSIEKCQKKLLAPSVFTVNMEQYKKAVLGWSKTKNASGYYIVRVIDGNRTEIDVKNVTEYTDDLKNYDENKQVTYYIYPYVVEDGSKKMGENKVSGGQYIRYKPLSNLRCETDGAGNIVVKWNGYTDTTGNYIDLKYNVYIAESPDGPYRLYKTTYTSYTTSYKESDNKIYYVRVAVEGRSVFYATYRELTSLQETPLKIGKLQEITKPEQPATKPTQSAPVQATSAKLEINQSKLTVRSVKIGTTVNDFLNLVNEKKYCQVRKNSIAVSVNQAVATGMQLCIVSNGKIVKAYNIIVTGDTNGDGKINITDMLSIKQNILGRSSFKGIYQIAADMNGDGKINITDFIKAKAKILGKE